MSSSLTDFLCGCDMPFLFSSPPWPTRDLSDCTYRYLKTQNYHQKMMMGKNVEKIVIFSNIRQFSSSPLLHQEKQNHFKAAPLHNL